MSKILAQSTWIILDALADGSEPFECVGSDVVSIDPALTPDDTRDAIFFLYQSDYVEISQQPLPGAQSFPQRAIVPNCPLDVTGDLSDSYAEYCKSRDFLKKVNSAGIPFGIYIELTESGRKEWPRPEYKCYWYENHRP